MASTISAYGDVFAQPLMSVWAQFSAGLLVTVVAIIIIILGLLIASLLSHAARKLVEGLKIDTLTTRVRMLRRAQEAGWKIKPSYLVGWIVKWFVIIVTLLTVSEYLGLGAVSLFLAQIIAFIPQVIVAVVLLVIGFILAQFAYDVTKQSVSTSHMSEDAQKIIPLVARWAIIIVAALAALDQLGVARETTSTFFTGIVFAFSLAAGLAFGLGGKDHASRILDRFSNR